MENKQRFEEVKTKNIPILESICTHSSKSYSGGSVPSFSVLLLFDTMSKKIEGTDSQLPELKEEFEKLREITNNYTVPTDVCESYEAVYNMLAELDKAYQT